LKIRSGAEIETKPAAYLYSNTANYTGAAGLLKVEVLRIKWKAYSYNRALYLRSVGRPPRPPSPKLRRASRDYISDKVIPTENGYNSGPLPLSKRGDKA